MLDKTIGSIMLDEGNIVLNSRLTPELFMTTPLYKGGSVDTSYLLKDAQEISGKHFLITLFFDNGRLKEVRLAEVMHQLSLNKWTEDLELAKKQRHDQWLLTLLGKGPYQYSWGRVESVFDKKGCVSSIILRYYHDTYQ